MRSLTLAAAILVASAGVASAACMNPYSGMATGDDCSVTHDSWTTWHGDHYTAMDLDQDGMISEDEFSQAYADRNYGDVDRNQDGMISVEEWQEGYDRDFDAFDVDKNGTLSQEELQGDTQKGS